MRSRRDTIRRPAAALIAAGLAAMPGASPAAAAPSLVDWIAQTEVIQRPPAEPRLTMSITTHRYGVSDDRRWLALRTTYRAAALGGWRIVGLKVWHTYAPGLAFYGGSVSGALPDVTGACRAEGGGGGLQIGGAVLPPLGSATVCPGLRFVIDNVRILSGDATPSRRDDVFRFGVQGYPVDGGVAADAMITDDLASLARAPRGGRPAGTTRVRVRIERDSECVERVVFHDARRDGGLRQRRERPGSRWRDVDCMTPF